MSGYNTRMRVHVHLYTQSQHLTLTHVTSTYQKGDLYCVLQESGVVSKFPLQHIFRIVEVQK